METSHNQDQPVNFTKAIKTETNDNDCITRDIETEDDDKKMESDIEEIVAIPKEEPKHNEPEPLKFSISNILGISKEQPTSQTKGKLNNENINYLI